ncbi:RNA polymerase sigma factor [Bacteroidota bacterium]
MQEHKSVLEEKIVDILRGCKAGNRMAQEKLYNTFSAKLFGVCLRYTKDITEAEDVLQDGFLKIYNNISQYREKGSFEGWMRKIIINTALERYRKQNLLFPVSEIYESNDFIKYDNLISDISANELLKIIQQLPPRYKLVFNLYAIEGYKHKEVAEKLGITTGTSKSNLARARYILQKQVNILHSEKQKNRIS